MLVVMRKDATADQIRGVLEAIEVRGFKGHPIPGAQRTAIGITGNKGALEAPAFEISPELARLRQGTQASLGRVVRMSGSGSTLFTLFDDQSAASQAAEKIRTDLRIKAAAVPLAPKS